VADIVPPDTRAAGQPGHIQDHNDISDVLADHEALLGALPSSMAWGSASLVAGTVTINNALALSSSTILVSRMTPGGTTGHLSVPTITSGVSFVVNSSSVSDTSKIAYLILNP
jgi:hypothetical protein